MSKFRFISAVAVLAVSGQFALADMNLSPAQKNKVNEVLDVVEESLKKKGVLGNTLSSELNKAGDPGGANAQVMYESGATFQKMINELRNMLDQNRIVIAPENDRWNMQTQRQDGLGGDKIRINKKIMDQWCNSIANNPASNPKEAFRLKVQMGSSLLNEGTHVFQREPADADANRDAKFCDMDRDSDTASMLFSNYMNLLFFNNSGPGDINAQDCPKMAACFTRYGVTAANWSDVATGIDAVDTGYSVRRGKFDTFLTGGTSWREMYYGASRRPRDSRSRRTGNDSVEVESFGGNTRTFMLPAGQEVIRDAMTTSNNGDTVLAVTSTDNAGNMQLFIWRDSDADELPDNPPSVVAFPAPAPIQPIDGDMRMYPFLAGDPADFSSGWTLVNGATGNAYEMVTDNDGLPAGPINFVFSDPLLADPTGGLNLLLLHDPSDPLVPQLVLCDAPWLMEYDQPAFVIDVDPVNRTWTTDLPQPVFIGGALAPNNGLGVTDLTLPDPIVFGNPGSAIDIFLIGQGPPSLLGTGIIDPLGTSSPPFLIPPTSPPLLFHLQAVVLDPIVGFKPTVGVNTACAVGPENQDTTEDRVHLSVDPPRLHFFSGVPATAPQSYDLRYELVLESDAHRWIRSWDNVNGRVLSGLGPDAQIAEVLFPQPDLPFYIQSLHDFDGDLGFDEAPLLLRQFPNPNFQLQILDGIPGAPVPVQNFPIPFEPGVVLIGDLNGNLFPDVQVTEFPFGPGQCFFNDGFGLFVPGPCPPACPGDGTHDGIVDINDLNIVVGNFGNVGVPGTPGDVNLDGSVDINDLNLVLGNFGTMCP